MPSSDAPNSPDRENASKLASPSDSSDAGVSPEQLETFEIEVTAGNAPLIDIFETKPVSSEPATAKATSPAISRANSIVGVPEGIYVGELREETVDASIAERAPLPIRIEETDESAPAKAEVARRVARQSSWWISSAGVHVIVLVALALTTLAIDREPELELYAMAPAYEPVEEFDDLEIDPTDDLESLEEELDEPDPASLEELTEETFIEEPTITETSATETATADVLNEASELSGLMGDIGTNLAGMDSEVGEGTSSGMAKFFGTEVKARRILYMLDNSGGMRKSGKFEALIEELKRSVSGLNAKQEFYVIFYSDTVYPLFYPQGVRKFVRSNDRNRKLLDRWLDSVELCGGNAIDEALAAANVIRPEAVFLLTDGDLFTTDKKKALLLNPAGRSFAIHTFGLGVSDTTKTAERLRQVAEANSGTYRAIKVTDEMKTLANQKQRPYHSKEPGPVWGLKVGGR